MDVYCSRCAEPWDNDTIHEEVSLREENGEEATYQQVFREFQRTGCVTFREFSGSPDRPSWCVARNDARTDAISMLNDLLGDDSDGISSSMADAEYLGYF